MRRRYHLRLPFLVYCGLTTLVAIAAINGGSNLLFWVFGVMASALLVSGALSGFMLVHLSIRRLLPSHGVVGEPFSVRYVVRNRSRLLPAFNVAFEERPVDAAFGWSERLRSGLAWAMHIGPSERVHAEAVFWPQARGEAWFDELRVRTSFPFGIIGKSITIAQRQRGLVFPRVLVLRRRVLDAIAPGGTVGVKITQHAGAGDDYFGLREFRPGDSLRHIAWKRTANRDQLLCVERTEPNPPKLYLVLNLVRRGVPAGAAEEVRAREELAITLIASIAHGADAAGYDVGLSILGLSADAILPRRSHQQRNKIMAALAEIDLDADRIPPRSATPTELEPAGIVVVHPGRADLGLTRDDAWHFSVDQIEHLLELPDALAPTVDAALGRRAAAPEAVA